MGILNMNKYLNQLISVIQSQSEQFWDI